MLKNKLKIYLNLNYSLTEKNRDNQEEICEMLSYYIHTNTY